MRRLDKTDLWFECWNWLLPVRLRVIVWNWCFDHNFDHREMKRIGFLGW